MATQPLDVFMSFLATLDKVALDEMFANAQSRRATATEAAVAPLVNMNVSFIVHIPSSAHESAGKKTVDAIKENCSKMSRHQTEWEDLEAYHFDPAASTATLTFKTAKSMSVACCVPDISLALGFKHKMDHSHILSPKWVAVESDDPHIWDCFRPPKGNSAHRSDAESQHLQALSSENSVSLIRLQVKFQHLLMLLPFEEACRLLAFGISINGEKHRPKMANTGQFPIFCFNCYGPDHYATALGPKSRGCPNEEQCGFCAEFHGTVTCTRKDSHVSINDHPIWKCRNCGESHTAWSPQCESPDVLKMRSKLTEAGWDKDTGRGEKRVQELLQPLSAQGLRSSPPPSTPAGPPTGTPTSSFTFRSSPPPSTPLTGTAASPIDLVEKQKAVEEAWSRNPIMRRQAPPLPSPSRKPNKVTAPKAEFDRHNLEIVYRSLPSESQREVDEMAQKFPRTRKRGRPPGPSRTANPKKHRSSSYIPPPALDPALSDDQVIELINKGLALSRGLDKNAHSDLSADGEQSVVSDEFRAQIGAPAPASSPSLPPLAASTPSVTAPAATAPAATTPAATQPSNPSSPDKDQLLSLLAEAIAALNKVSIAFSS